MGWKNTQLFQATENGLNSSSMGFLTSHLNWFTLPYNFTPLVNSYAIENYWPGLICWSQDSLERFPLSPFSSVTAFTTQSQNPLIHMTKRIGSNMISKKWRLQSIVRFPSFEVVLLLIFLFSFIFCIPHPMVSTQEC